MSLNLTLNTENKTSIQSSFDRIARDLIDNWSLIVNNNTFSFTEIEFYFFLDRIHEDNATHEQNYKEGLWRFHLQGLDITFQSTEHSDGGILLRGLKCGNEYINGPKRVLEAIFKSFASATETNQKFGLVPRAENSPATIMKTARHGLSARQNNQYITEPYRYYTDLDNWNLKHVNRAEKERILKASYPL